MATQVRPSEDTNDLGPAANSSKAVAARVLLVLLILVSAILVPYIGARFGWIWGMLAWGAGVAALLLALRFNPRASTRVGRATRLINWLSIASPQVNQFLGRVAETDRINIQNAGMHSNMTTLLASYGLPGTGTAAPVLDAPVYTADASATRVSLNDLSASASAALIASDPDLADGQSTLETCLAVLYLEQFQHADLAQINEVKRAWRANRTENVGRLAELMAQHPVFEFGSYGAPQIAAVLRGLDGNRLPTLAAVVDQLKQSPEQIVRNMDVVGRRFGFGGLRRADWDVIAPLLSRVSYAGTPGAAARQFADRIAEESERDAVANHLELLYRDRFGRPNEAIWATYTQDAALRSDLARRLAASGVLVAEGDQSAESPPTADAKADSGTLEALLEALGAFDLELLRVAFVRVNAFWDLTVAYADDLVERGMPTSPDFVGPTPSDRFISYLVDAGARPRSEAELGLLDEPTLVVPLLVEIAEESIERYGCVSDEPAQPVAHPHQARALATVSVGRYLMGDGARPHLAAALARQCTLAEPVVDVLLAALWQRRTRIDRGDSGKVALAELVCRHRRWHDHAHTQFGDELCNDLNAAIAAQLSNGEWPTRLPLDWMLERFAERIIAESRTPDPDSAREIDSIKREVELLAASKSDISQHLDRLIERITRFDPRAGDTERDRKLDDVILALGQVRERPLEELTVAVNDLRRIDLEMQMNLSALDDTDREVGRTVRDLEAVDMGVVRGLDHLAETDEELKMAVERLLNAVPSTSGTYLITWPARSGRMAELMADLARPSAANPLTGEYSWESEQRTPYARLGRLPLGVSFDEFCEHLREDLATVYRDRRTREPKIWRGKHPHVYVQQVANRVDQAVSNAP